MKYHEVKRDLFKINPEEFEIFSGKKIEENGWEFPLKIRIFSNTNDGRFNRDDFELEKLDF